MEKQVLRLQAPRRASLRMRAQDCSEVEIPLAFSRMNNVLCHTLRSAMLADFVLNLNACAFYVWDCCFIPLAMSAQDRFLQFSG